MDEAIRQAFAEEAVPLAAALEARMLGLERRARDLHGEWRGLLGELHTLKGNCGMVGLDGAQALAHAMEHRAREVRGWAPEGQARAIDDLLRAADRLRAAIEAASDEATPTVELRDEIERLQGLGSAPAATAAAPEPAPAEPRPRIDDAAGPVAHVRVAADRLDRMLDVVGDLIAWHARLRMTLPRAARRRGARDQAPWAEALDEIDRRFADLRGQVTDLRLVPLSFLFARFERLVRDLSRAVGKPVELTVNGGDLAVEKLVVDCLAEPMLHIVRNAIDHGLEPPRARAIANKPERGQLSIDARTHGGILTVTVRDDGRGIDGARLIAAADRAGIDASDWPRAQVLDLVFAPDVSTAERVTTLSGRGVGLDQARRALERIGGTIEVRSEPGVGTEFDLRVPMVIAVQRSLLVRCGAEVYGLPFTSVVEAFRVSAEPTEGAIAWRGQDLPTCSLAREVGVTLDVGHRPTTCVVIDAVNAPIGVLVDAVIGHEDLAIRELDPIFERPRGVMGASLLADGRVVPVIDLHGIGRAARGIAIGVAH